MVSEAVDIPDRSYSSEDLCSLEVQGSLHSADLSPYCITPKGAAEQSCSAALDCHTHCRFHRTRSEGFPEEGDSSHSRASTDRSQGQEKSCAHSRSLDSSSGNYSPSERELQSSAQESSATPPLKQKRTCCVDFGQPPAPLQTSPCFGPANASPCASGHEAAAQHGAKPPASSIVRSSSAPVSCSSASEGRRVCVGPQGTKSLLLIAQLVLLGIICSIPKRVVLGVKASALCVFSKFEIFKEWKWKN